MLSDATRTRRGTILRVAIVALALVASGRSHAVAQVPDPDRPLEGEAYTFADEAYTAFGKGDYATAAARAAQSVELRPDMLRLQLLLVDARIAAGDLKGADQAIAKAAELFSSNPDLEARKADIRHRLALRPADEAYKALARGEPVAAIRAARSAIEYAPDEMSHRLLLLSAQLASNNLADAMMTASDARQLDPGNYVPIVWSGYIHQRLGDHTLASADFSQALALPSLTDVEKKNIRLIAADAALASGDHAEALRLLGNYPRTDPLVGTRRSDAESAADATGTLKGDSTMMPAPVQDCRTTPYGPECSLEAPVVQSVITPIIVAPVTSEPVNQALITPVPLTPAEKAYQAAGKAYEAERAKDYKRAVAEARKALEYDPDVAATRVLLINLLISSGRGAEAETEATRAIRQGHAGAEVYAQRGYARNLQHNARGAMSDWDMALQLGLPAAQTRTVRLALADAAIADKQPARALRALQNLPSSYETAVRRAYALQALGRKEESLVAFGAAEKMGGKGEQRDGAIRAEINTLLDLGRKPEARAIFERAIGHGELRSIRDADVAYLAVGVENDKVALELFDRAAADGKLPPRATIDAGYTAMRRFENAKAIDYLKQGIDAKDDGRIDIDEQKLFETRRTVTDLWREWGVNTSVTYSKVGSAPNPFQIVSTPASSYTGQLGTELYYRPEGFGNQNGALFDVFVRLFDTLYSQSGGATGWPAMQGVVGARWKPLSSQNLVLEVDRFVEIGNQARNDTLLRVAYSYTVGTDLRVLDKYWPTWYVYAELDKFLQQSQLVGIMEGRFGESFRLDMISNKLVLFPHVVLAANYDDSYANRQAYSAGAGASLRYWFRETKYLAPPSYLEMTLQYRWRLAGDDRARGIFAQTTINY